MKEEEKVTTLDGAMKPIITPRRSDDLEKSTPSKSKATKQEANRYIRGKK